MSENKKRIYMYESPDGGDTIYRREKLSSGELGARVMVKGNNAVYEMLKQYDENDNTDDTVELEGLRQEILNLEMANAELKDMLRNMGVAI